MDMPVFKIWVAPLALGECTMSDFENPQHKLYALGDLMLSIFQQLCMFISWPKNTQNLTTLVDFNFQPTSLFLKSWWWKKELISADRQNNKKIMGSTTKIGNHFMGRNMMPGIHIYLQTKPLSPASQEPRLPPYKSVMLCWQKHGWWKITETPDESCWHMPVSNSFVTRLECVDLMGFACCFTNQIGTLFCQERANKGGDISTWWAN